MARSAVGAPGAGIPEAHAGVMAPDVALELDQRGMDLDREFNLIGSRRSFRSIARGVPSQAQGGPLTASQDQRARIHHGTGQRDYRATDEAERGHVLGELGHENGPEHASNSRRNLDTRPVAPPVRPKLGWTGADNTRPAWMIRPLFMRPFDKHIAEHPGAVEKIPQPAPRAAYPRNTDDLAGHVWPSPGGHRGTRSRGLAQLAQTFRVVPATWGTDKVAEPAAVPAAASRGRTFR